MLLVHITTAEEGQNNDLKVSGYLKWEEDYRMA